MIPPNYDDDEEEEDEDEQEGQLGRGKASGGRRGGKGATAHAASAHVSLPLVVSNKLTVTALGEVVWLSRWFHDEKYIYPVRQATSARAHLQQRTGFRSTNPGILSSTATKCLLSLLPCTAYCTHVGCSWALISDALSGIIRRWATGRCG